jgi:hypothetical protein
MSVVQMDDHASRNNLNWHPAEGHVLLVSPSRFLRSFVGSGLL